MNTLYSKLMISPGITAFVGAGGKSTAMETVALELFQEGHSVAVSTTTHIFPPSNPLFGVPRIAPSPEEIRLLAEQSRLCVIGNHIDENGKLTGISSAVVSGLTNVFEYVLIEADGSKRLPCKVPAAHEPVIPDTAGRIVGVIGMSALYQPLSSACFRFSLAEAEFGLLSEEPITPELLAHIVVSEKGLQKGVDSRPFTLLLNQQELFPKETRKTAALCHQAGIKQVVVASLAKQIWMIL